MTSTVAAAAVEYARSKIGDPYEWGHEGPSTFDCSGLVWAAYWHAGLHWSRTSADVEITRGIPVPRSGLLVGDLVQPHPGHIQLYSGHGRIVEAPKTGLDVREVPMWGFYRACRVVRMPAPTRHPYPGHLIRYGARGPAVRLIQHRVGTAVDGIFGPHTRDHVRAFQHQHHLVVDGIVGPRTWGAMF
jgi:peptidoglycan hydrolase-like protein with peptidoglycan-binding domain